MFWQSAMEIMEWPVRSPKIQPKKQDLFKCLWVLHLVSLILQHFCFLKHQLVGGSEHFLIFHILEISSSQLPKSYFWGVGWDSEDRLVVASWLLTLLLHGGMTWQGMGPVEQAVTLGASYFLATTSTAMSQIRGSLPCNDFLWTMNIYEL